MKLWDLNQPEQCPRQKTLNGAIGRTPGRNRRGIPIPIELIPSATNSCYHRGMKEMKGIKALENKAFFLPLSRRLRELAKGPFLVAAALLALVSQPANALEPLNCERLPQLFQEFLQKHIQFNYLNDELRARAADSYIKRLDSSKSLYLEKEADDLRLALRGVFLDIKNGDCGTLVEIQEDLVTRYGKLEKFSRVTLGDENYTVDPETVLILDPDKRSRPKTPKERELFTKKLIGFQMSNYLSNDLEMPEAKEKLIHRYELMTRRAEEQTETDVYATFLDSFASALDPHSNYLSPEADEDFQIEMTLSLEGIGVALSSQDGYSVVERIVPGGATDKLGVLETKDKIIAVAQEDGEPVDIIDMDLRDVVRLIRGKRGTKVHLTVLRQSEGTQRLNITIVRDRIDLEDAAAKLRFETLPVPQQTADESEAAQETLKLAVLELPKFYGGRKASDRQSERDMRKLLEDVKEEKADGLLLDLSRNGGGGLDNSVAIAGLFIADGGIVAVKSDGNRIQVLPDPDASIVFDGPLVVLTSRVSASASEIVAGAMKDYRRAVLVGDDHTFGKGTVQSLHPLPPTLGAGALKVTAALFFRPGGDSTQHDGVAMDLVLPSVMAAQEIGEKHQDYSLPTEQIPAFGGISRTSDQSSNVQWLPITDERLSELRRRSSERIADNEEFDEIRDRAAEVRDKNGIVQLADILNENEEEEEEEEEKVGEETGVDAEAAAGDVPQSQTETPVKSEAEEGDDTADDEPSPQQAEALRILIDHVLLTRNPASALATEAATDPKS